MGHFKQLIILINLSREPLSDDLGNKGGITNTSFTFLSLIDANIEGMYALWHIPFTFTFRGFIQ